MIANSKRSGCFPTTTYPQIPVRGRDDRPTLRQLLRLGFVDALDQRITVHYRITVLSTADTADHATFDEKAVRKPLPNRRRLNLIRDTTTTTASPQRQRRHHTQHGTAEHPTRSLRWPWTHLKSMYT
jgi:hypothetical protein